MTRPRTVGVALVEVRDLAIRSGLRRCIHPAATRLTMKPSQPAGPTWLSIPETPSCSLLQRSLVPLHNRVNRLTAPRGSLAPPTGAEPLTAHGHISRALTVQVTAAREATNVNPASGSACGRLATASDPCTTFGRPAARGRLSTYVDSPVACGSCRNPPCRLDGQLDRPQCDEVAKEVRAGWEHFRSVRLAP